MTKTQMRETEGTKKNVTPIAVFLATDVNVVPKRTKNCIAVVAGEMTLKHENK